MNDKVNTGLRYAGVSGATLITVLGAIGELDPANTKLAIDAIHQVTQGFSTLFTVLGPVIGGILAALGIKSTGLAPAIIKVLSDKRTDVKDGQITAPPEVVAEVKAALPTNQVATKP